MAQIYRDIMDGTRNLVSSLMDSRLNNVMQRLTSITLILSIPTVISGLYGMNVDLSWMPHGDRLRHPFDHPGPQRLDVGKQKQGLAHEERTDGYALSALLSHPGGCAGTARRVSVCVRPAGSRPVWIVLSKKAVGQRVQRENGACALALSGRQIQSQAVWSV